MQVDGIFVWLFGQFYVLLVYFVVILVYLMVIWYIFPILVFAPRTVWQPCSRPTIVFLRESNH
jgi:hypothetical protein